MLENTNLLLVALPETLQFLHGGWFVVHFFGICIFVYLGYKLGRIKES